MYKVFFNDRTAFLHEQDPTRAEQYKGLCYRFTSREELNEVLERFSGQEHTRQLHISHSDLPGLTEAFKGCFTNIDAAGGLVFNSKGKFLTIKRNGTWDLPKGKLKKAEDFEDAALREVEEETGLENLITVQPLVSTYHTYPLKDQKVLKRTVWFEMLYSGQREPQLQAAEGITDHRWVDPGAAGFIVKNTYQSILDVLRIKELI